MPGLLFLWGLLITLGCAGAGAGTGDTSSATGDVEALVLIRDARYTVDLAVTAAERQQGLSGREQMPIDQGMLFVFEEERQLSFWMKEMRFPLDIIWIDGQCRLIGVSADVPIPHPGADDSEIPRTQSPSPAKYVLELNAGEWARSGFSEGDVITFEGSIRGQHDC